MTDRPRLLLLPQLSPALTQRLGKRFAVTDTADAQVRGVVGGGGMRIDAALLAKLPALEIVAVFGVGHDGLDLPALKARGVRVTITAGVLTDDVADLAMALMLDTWRGVAANDRRVRAGGWDVPLTHRASGRTVGIFGMGAIGQAIASRAAPFAREVIYTARSPRPALPWRFVPEIAQLAAQSDTLILAAPATPETRDIIDAQVLAALGPTGVLINIGRGALVDQPALIAALESGGIAGAGLDVFADEPHVPAALLALDTVVLSPHQGSATVETRAVMADLVIANLDAHFAGRPLPTPLL